MSQSQFVHIAEIPNQERFTGRRTVLHPGLFFPAFYSIIFKKEDFPLSGEIPGAFSEIHAMEVTHI